jgi:hypothetical protein
MGHHPAVLLAVAERLAQPEGGWRRQGARGAAVWGRALARAVGLTDGRAA